MATTDITITLRAEYTFDPPDCAPGWYITVWTQFMSEPRMGMRYGPIDFEHLERVRAGLLAEEGALIEKSMEYLKRNITETIQRNGVLQDRDRGKRRDRNL